MTMRLRSPLLWTVATFALAALLWAGSPAKVPPPDLAANLPPGALMTLESADFSTLLSSWIHSPEQRAWLGSASYSAFTGSRLFGRLADAQDGFANAAHTPVGPSLLQQVAGKESIFAWYDIGNLEFLYITHLNHAQIAAVPLLQQRSHFARRESAGTPFYVRTGTAAADASATGDADTAAPAAPDASQELDQPRTVAFAVRGDWLLLATREDLLANALQLMAAQGGTQAPTDSQANVGWFAAASAAAPSKHGDLHMLLDLQSLTKTPQFRSYWIQRNVTDMRRFRAAVVDLYREPHRFREERVLLPMEPPATANQTDLGQLEALVPPQVGVYRATANPTPGLILSTLDEKLLNGISTGDTHLADNAPSPATVIPVSGSVNDLDLRIDGASTAMQDKPETPEETLAALRHVLDTAQVESMLTLDRSGLLNKDLPFVRVQSAVILRSVNSWDTTKLTQAFSAALRPRLTTASLGLTWQQSSAADKSCFALTGVQPLALCAEGPVVILSNDAGLLSEILSRRLSTAKAQPAQLIAAIHPGQERANFQRLTNQLDQPLAASDVASPETSVQLFRDNLPSLVKSFSDLESEHVLVRNDGPVVRETVIYTWTASPGAQ